MEDFFKPFLNAIWEPLVNNAPSWLQLVLFIAIIALGVFYAVARYFGMTVPQLFQKMRHFGKSKNKSATAPAPNLAAPQDWQAETVRGVREGALNMEEAQQIAALLGKEKKYDQSPGTNPADQDPFIAEFVALATSADRQEREAAALALEGKIVAAYEILGALAEQDASKTAERWKAAGAIAFNAETAKAINAYERAIGTSPNDADAHNKLGHLYSRIGDLPRAEQAYEKIMALGNQTEDKELQAVAAGNLGNLEHARGNIDKAEGWGHTSLRLFEQLGRSGGMANSYGNLGNIELTRGNLNKAKDWLQKSLSLNDKLGSKEGMAGNYGNLGMIELTRGNFDKAEDLYKKCLSFTQHINNKLFIAGAYGNLGNIEQNRGNLDKAEKWLQKSLSVSMELDNKEGMAAVYGNLGIIEDMRGNPERAEEWHKKSLAMNEELGQKENMASSYGNLGNLELNRDNLEKAEDLYKKSLALNKELGRKEGMATTYANLGLLEKNRKNFPAAKRYWQQAHDLYDQIDMPHKRDEMKSWLDATASSAPTDQQAK